MSGTGRSRRGKKTTITCTVIAGELAGFMGAVAKEVEPRGPGDLSFTAGVYVIARAQAGVGQRQRNSR